ncbi:MAG: UDP-N-acetylglucosamine 2-epimerase (non-hydrolyzing) [Thermodesulfobacteriota bacterium]
MKVMTVLGTRPEIIRLSLIVKKLDSLCDHVLVHTGQNYDENLNEVFLDQLKVRDPDHHLGARGSFGEQMGKILPEIERVMLSERPDRFLVLGDTNSSLAAIMAKRLGIPVYHMEAGNRCYDDRVPEEVNRRIIDHSSDILLPYTERSRANLIREGIPGERIYVTGNPIYEVLEHFKPRIEVSTALSDLGLEEGNYFLVTLHRAENVDVEERLGKFVEAFDLLHKEYGIPVVCSLHPRTRKRLEKLKRKMGGGVRAIEPLGLFDFVHLEQRARCVLSDSGTVQEECCIFKVPAVTTRDVTERPETIEAGSNMLSGAEPESILRCVKTVLEQPRDWSPPPEYLVGDVSSTVVKIVLGYKWR